VSFGNSIMAAVLRSPLHGMMSRSLLLLTYTGRRSGKQFTLPLQYLEDGTTLAIWAGAPGGKTWWRNFETPEAVTVRLRGVDRAGTAHLITNAAARARYVREYVSRFPYTTPSGRPKFFGKRWHPDDAELARVADAVVMVAIELDN
jgi:deazaflavin-dependent oxidoreductase (nitroreductase family)